MERSKVIVVGAGLSGLLAAIMLRDRLAVVVERQPGPPDNHSAVLRFQNSAVAEITNTEFKEVTVVKTVIPWLNPVADALSYSLKTNGTATMRSVLTADSKPVKRLIAPPDLPQRMAAMVGHQVQYNLEAWPNGVKNVAGVRDAIISTIPMPALMKALGYNKEHLFLDRTRSAVNVRATLNGVDAYVTLYTPSPNLQMSRVSLTGNQLIIECPFEETSYAENRANDYEWIRARMYEACDLLGLSESRITDHQARFQRYAKILPIDEAERKRFIRWATAEHSVYSLGRFACWRPKTVMDDIPHDVRQIMRLIDDSSNSYEHDLKRPA